MDDPIDETREPIPFSRIALSFEKGVEHLDGRAKHYARSAFVHLRKAWALLGIDEEMAAFRAITAEEEAASAIFMSLQKCGYRGAQILNPRNHTHKASLFPFLEAVGKLHTLIEFAEPSVFVDESHTPFSVKLRLNAEKFIGVKLPEPKYILPVPPLHYVVHDSNGKLYDFSKQLSELTSEKGADSIRAFINKEANFRNRLLYAAPNGIPKVPCAKQFVIARINRVTALITIQLLIEQSNEPQSFAQQCLDAFLRVHDKLVEHDYEYPKAEMDEGIFVQRDFGKEPKAVLLKKRRLPYQLLQPIVFPADKMVIYKPVLRL